MWTNCAKLNKIWPWELTLRENAFATTWEILFPFYWIKVSLSRTRLGSYSFISSQRMVMVRSREGWSAGSRVQGGPLPIQNFTREMSYSGHFCNKISPIQDILWCYRPTQSKVGHYGYLHYNKMFARVNPTICKMFYATFLRSKKFQKTWILAFEANTATSQIAIFMRILAHCLVAWIIRIIFSRHFRRKLYQVNTACPNSSGRHRNDQESCICRMQCCCWCELAIFIKKTRENSISWILAGKFEFR